MSPQLIIAFVLVASSFIGGWTAKSWQVGYKEKARVEQVLEQQRINAAAAIRRHDTVQEAQAASTAREAQLRADADGARSADDRLLVSRTRALRAATASQAACLDRAAALSELLGTVATAGRELAEKAGRHANDARTCHDAWPQ